MHFSTTYDVTPAIQDASVKQFFWHVLLRPKIGGIMVVFIALIVMFALDFPYKPWIVGFFTAMFLFLFVAWTKTYFQIIAQAREGLALLEHPKVEVSLDDSLIEYVSSTGTRRHRWEKIERIEETRDFMIFMAGKLPLLSLPKACFTSAVIDFMKEKTNPGR